MVIEESYQTNMGFVHCPIDCISTALINHKLVLGFVELT